MSDIQARNELYSAMAGGTPYKTYKKTILGRVFVTIWDNYSEGPVGMLLEGDPKKNDPDCFYDVWSEKEDVFFRKTSHNRHHLKHGTIIPVVREVVEEEPTIETSSDEDIEKILKSKFFTLQNTLNKTDSIGFLYRLLGMAKDLEKSEKITSAIERRISEVQSAEFQAPTVDQSKE